ncbi:MAG: hypothetical protein UV37_C0003G0003 [Candidatus Collierbacteria bacterium GW2011_GWA1_42_60]|nr:MAG: hypothetical protein UV37_C0003G0003 [Candidatus Collierbacteria bacterium GW2011_GWA1_42_60]
MKASIKDKILLILGSAFLIVLLGLLVYDVTRRGVYSSKMGLNMVIVGEESVSVLLVRPEEGMVGWINMPKNIRIKVFNSEAHYPLMFSVGLKTDLSIRDRVLIRQFMADAVKSKKVLEMTVPGSVFDSVTDPDGKEFKEFNQTMSLWTKNKFVIEPILDENADVSINNVSGIPGLGSILANQLESAGMHVIELKADAEESVEGRGCVYSTDRRYEMTEKVLREQVGCTKIAQPEFVVDKDEKMRKRIVDFQRRKFT